MSELLDDALALFSGIVRGATLGAFAALVYLLLSQR